MGLIDNRPRDWAYKIAFDRKDLPSLQEMVKHIRETHDVDMIEEINARCEQKLSGEVAVLDNGVEIQGVIKTEDLVVNVGLQQCINIIQGSAARWSHIAFSPATAGAPTPDVTNTSLFSSSPNPVSMATYGWSEAKGMKLFFGIIYPQDFNAPFGNQSISEIGVCNGSSAPPTSTLLNREWFFNNRPIRTQTPDISVFTSIFLFSCVIEFCPVA